MATPPAFLSLAEAAADPACGARAARLAQLGDAGLPVPRAVILPPEAVSAIAAGASPPALPGDMFPVVAIRSSPEVAGWGGPPALLNVGASAVTHSALSARVGEALASEVRRRSIQTYADRVLGLDPVDFDPAPGADAARALRDALSLFEAETGASWPKVPAAQLALALRAMAQEWAAPTARMLRQARGAPEAAGLALIVQEMVIGLGADGGAGQVQTVDGDTGERCILGRFLPEAEGPETRRSLRAPRMLTASARVAAKQVAPSLEDTQPHTVEALTSLTETAARAFGDEMQLDFVVEAGQVAILDAAPVRRSAEGAIRIAVDLAERGIIARRQALLMADPEMLTDMLHPQIDPLARRDVIGRGLAASPGAAAGVLAFSAEAVLALEARGEPAILARLETNPEDIRAMHAAAGALTVRGGMTSHAAVIARGLGRPCVVGAADMALDPAGEALMASDGRRFGAGAWITVDGTRGEVLAGEAAMRAPAPGPAFHTLLSWADAVRRLGVRANADTGADAETARKLGADGIGLCRTEHMFFEGDRLDLMRAMILAEGEGGRAEARETLRVRHTADLAQLFQAVPGQPVAVRLLDPPLHEFLPAHASDIARLADATGQSVEAITTRIAHLREFNPMLGRRGVRLGIAVPEIYDMQIRAILEAAASAPGDVVPDIMIPLVSALREVELISTRVAAIAAGLEDAPQYRLGVMIETPRGALRAGDIARASAFLSFGTNDLTQMTYGLSRDDAGRFMGTYIAEGVFRDDPFHTLDTDGVGELLTLAVERGLAGNPEAEIGLCGEHGGDPASIAFCHARGFDYVSCSPFRVPGARLSAAQAAIRAGESPG
ncbi:MAG: putative PEP-binding protein [Pseudomonadota bacterium]